MRKYHFYLISLALFVGCTKPECPDPVGSGTSTTKTVVLQPGSEGKDANIINLFPNNNGGNNAWLAIEAWTASGVPRVQRALIDFDYSSIPTGASITKATLTLYADTTYDFSAGSVPPGHSKLSGYNDWSLYRINSPWDENSVNWNYMPTFETSSGIPLDTSTSASESYVIDVTTFVKDQIANPSVYHGFIMKLNNEAYYRSIYFYSSDDSHAALHPKMVIDYK